MKHSFSIKFRVNYIILALVLALLLGVILFWLLDYNSIVFSIRDIVAYVVGSTAAITLFFHAMSLENQIKNQERQNAILKAKYTYDIISEYIKVDMASTATDIRKILKSEDRIKELSEVSRVKDFLKYLNDNPEEYGKLSLLLNYFENVGNMIQSDHIDHEIAKKSFKFAFISLYNKLKYYIEYRQQETPALWCNYEKVVLEWIKENKNN